MIVDKGPRTDWSGALRLAVPGLFPIMGQRSDLLFPDRVLILCDLRERSGNSWEQSSGTVKTDMVLRVGTVGNNALTSGNDREQLGTRSGTPVGHSAAPPLPLGGRAHARTRTRTRGRRP